MRWGFRTPALGDLVRVPSDHVVGAGELMTWKVRPAIFAKIQRTLLVVCQLKV